MMLNKWSVLIALCASSFSVQAQYTPSSDTLLDHMCGKWLLKGVLGGARIEHDIIADWALGHQYLLIKETSREKQANGMPAYEAMIFISRDTAQHQYNCLWLDNTSNAGLSNGIIAHAPFEPGRVALLFRFNDRSSFHTTLTLNPADHSWHWTMVSDENGKKEVFADALMATAP